MLSLPLLWSDQFALLLCFSLPVKTFDILADLRDLQVTFPVSMEGLALAELTDTIARRYNRIFVLLAGPVEKLHAPKCTSPARQA